ncbi:MAG: PRC-barrel domain-containing protein [Xanthobacteraceae bacterium]|nr:PRC-barrel domain-containing protein [Xanthobacteraceae bacterium]
MIFGSHRAEGTPVFRSSGEELGNIQRVMIDKLNGTVAYAVLSFGWFRELGRSTCPSRGRC